MDVAVASIRLLGPDGYAQHVGPGLDISAGPVGVLNLYVNGAGWSKYAVDPPVRIDKRRRYLIRVPDVHGDVAQVLAVDN